MPIEITREYIFEVIPYIASEYQKDKIWLRQTRPNKRDYQVVIVVDDSHSMSKSCCGDVAIEALVTVCRAMSQLVLLGDVGVGKSSLVLRFVKGQFIEFQELTIGAAFFSQTLAVNDATVKFEIWDTVGQERYHSLAPMYYRGAAIAAIIVYDLNNQASFE